MVWDWDIIHINCKYVSKEHIRTHPPDPYNPISFISYAISDDSNAIHAFCANGQRLLVMNWVDFAAACRVDDDDDIISLLMCFTINSVWKEDTWLMKAKNDISIDDNRPM